MDVLPGVSIRQGVERAFNISFHNHNAKLIALVEIGKQHHEVKMLAQRGRVSEFAVDRGDIECPRPFRREEIEYRREIVDRVSHIFEIFKKGKVVYVVFLIIGHVAGAGGS